MRCGNVAVALALFFPKKTKSKSTTNTLMNTDKLPFRTNSGRGRILRALHV